MEYQLREIDESEKEITQQRKKNSVTTKNFDNLSNSNSQITEMTNEQGVIPLREKDLTINVGDNRNLKVEEFMTNFISNVFENKNALFFIL